MSSLFTTRSGKKKRSRCRYVAVVTLDNEENVVVRANRVWRSHVWWANVAAPHALSLSQEKQVVREITDDIATFYESASISFEFFYKGDNHHVEF